MSAPREERAAGGADGWTLRLLGNVVRLEREGATAIPDVRTAVLLTLLAVDGPLPRDRAAALLWPDRPPTRARANLRQLLYRLRADADVVTGDPLALSPRVALDVDTIDPSGPAAGEGSLLDGYDLEDTGELGERFAAARARLVARVRERLQHRLEVAEQAGDTGLAAAAATSLAELEPLDEAAVQHAMRWLLSSGDASGALRLFVRSKEALARVLAVEPGDATVALARRAAASSARPFGADATHDATVPALAPPMPVPSETFVRHAEARGWMAEGAALLLAQAGTLLPGRERARLLSQAAWLDHQAGRDAAAEAAAHAALDDVSADDARDASARVEAWFVLGSIARQRGDLAAATAWWDRALDLAATRRGGTDELTLRLNLGLVADALGRTEDALDHYLTALPLAEEQGEGETLALLWNNLGHALLGRERTEDARRLLVRAVDTAGRSGDRRLRAYALEGLARCAHEDGDAAAARSLAADALATANEIGDPVLRVEAALSVAAADALAGDRQRALTTARAALGVARRHANRPGAIRAAGLIAEALGPDHDAARRAVVQLVVDPGAAADVRRRAEEIANAWGLALRTTPRDASATDGVEPSDATPDGTPWDEIFETLVTLR